MGISARNLVFCVVLLVTAPIYAFAAPESDDAFASGFLAEAKEAAQKYVDNVQILRDTWGVPHIFGKTDPDVAFGLAYAHAEDDFGTIQDVALSTRAIGGATNGADAALMDFIVHLLGVWDDVEAKYETDLSPETRALCEGYAAGINFYVALHPEEVSVKAIYPVTGKDFVAGFVFRGPFFYGLDSAVQELFGSERRRTVSEKKASLEAPQASAFEMAASAYFGSSATRGSNSFAVSPKRSANGETFLNINSHQPWTGPVAWYEAHLHSEDGWDAVGGVFPGSPIILHGHNRNLGWAHTVNRPDLVDIYVLEMNPDNANQYKFDGEWLDLDSKTVTLEVRMGKTSPATMKVRREILRSVHGPVIRQDHGVYAIRYAGMGDIRQVEQWYRMNKARNLDEWLDAVKMRAIPSLNCTYADKEGNILYLYNAMLPLRVEGYDWKQYLPGDTSETLWKDYLPFDKLPMVKNPPSGFIQNCNSSPFQTTLGDANPDPAAFSITSGIETGMTNRALRAVELLGGDDSITLDEFYTYKYDMKYAEQSFIGKGVEALRNAPRPKGRALRKAVDQLLKWDLSMDPENDTAALAIMTFLPLFRGARGEPNTEKILESLKRAAQKLEEVHGSTTVPWKNVNRLRRGDLDIGIGGGPDILHAVAGPPTKDGAHFVGQAGDSYILLVAWDAQGRVSSRSIHQFGSATLDASSPHYADQAPLFAARKTKPVWLDEAEIRDHLESEYRPGEETPQAK